MNKNNWNLRQYFQFRISTALVLYMPVLIAGIMFGRIFPSSFSDFLTQKLLACLFIGPLVTLAGSATALVLFLRSVVKRNPQMQFVVEASVFVFVFFVDHFPSH